jgi:tRNA 2-selenouridine synthase
LNRLVQPTQEQFENNFAHQLRDLDHHKKIWVEDESLSIGKNLIPKPFWQQMQTAPLFDLQVPAAQRILALVQEYGPLDKEFLVECTDRIRKRLGTESTKHAIAAIRDNRMDEFIRLVLVYYDKAYRTGLNNRNPNLIFPVPVKDADPVHNARQILDAAQALHAGTTKTTAANTTAATTSTNRSFPSSKNTII